jgi:Tol biopolymer transport system component
MRRVFGAWEVLSLCSLLFPPALGAFGQNKIVADAFQWRVARTEHFDIHHAPGEEAFAADAALWAERAYARLTKDLDVVPAGRTPLFIFSTHNRFEQNNIAPAGEGTGGVTEAFKNRVALFNDGSQDWLDHVITHEFTHVLQFEALYGGFWKSARLLKSPLYPLWAMEGLAEFGIGPIDGPEEDLYLRDAALDGKLYPLTELHGFSHLKPHQVTLGYKSGASFIRFLAREYGEDVPRKLLKGMRDRFDAAGVAGELTRQDFRVLDARWREYLTDLYRAQAARLDLREPETYGKPLTSADFLPSFNESPVLSPDGKRAAFMTDRNGPPEVALLDLETGVCRFPAGRQWGQVENLHTGGRSLSFSPDGRWLAFAGEKEQRDYVYLYDTKRDRLRRVRTPFEQVRAPVFHPSGDRLLLVGMRAGFNDLYEVSLRGALLRRLTDTRADERDPAYAPDGRSVAFSLESRRGGLWQRDLALVDLETLTVRPLTDLPGDETAPAWTPDGAALVFVGEALEGVRNLYRLDLARGEARLLTRALGGNFAPDIAKGGRMVFSAFRHNSQNVHLAGPELWNPAPSTGAVVHAGQPSRQGPPAPAAKAPAVPESVESIVFAENRPYRFKASTDLFFPLLYYSSQDGFFIAALWQASENLGNHEVQTSVQYGSGEDFLDYQVQYLYKRFRPQFLAGAGGETYYRDFERVEQRRDRERFVGVIYPLDRFRRLETVASAIHREDRFRGNFSAFSTLERENALAVSFVRDTATGRYLFVSDGSRLRLTQTAARKVLHGTRVYDASRAELQRFLPVGGEAVMAFRGIAGTSGGPTPQLFRIGGGDRVRGYPRNGEANQSSRFGLGNLEWRVPLKFMDEGVSLLPEVAFKALYGALFVDAGYDGTPGDRGARRARTSVGAGIRVPSFILQTYPVILTVDLARRTDNGTWSWYFSLGPEF